MRIGLIFAVLFFCNTLQARQHMASDLFAGGKTVFNSADSIPQYSLQITGCAGGDERKSRTPEKVFNNKSLVAEDPELTVQGDSIIYTRSVTHLCCRKLKVSVEQKDNVITLTEYWYHQGCKCRCSSTVNAVIKKLAKGNYTFHMIEGGTDPFNDKEILQKDITWSKSIIIN